MGRLEKAMADLPQRRRDSTMPPGLRRTASVVKRSSLVGGARRPSALASEPAAAIQTGTAGAPQAQSARSSITGVASGAHQPDLTAANWIDRHDHQPEGHAHCAQADSVSKDPRRIDAVLMRGTMYVCSSCERSRGQRQDDSTTTDRGSAAKVRHLAGERCQWHALTSESVCHQEWKSLTGMHLLAS